MNREELDTAAAVSEDEVRKWRDRMIAASESVASRDALLKSGVPFAFLARALSQLSSDAKTIEELGERCEELTRERDEAQVELNRATHGDVSDIVTTLGDALTRIGKLQAELSAARADAGRYRWLRTEDNDEVAMRIFGETDNEPSRPFDILLDRCYLLREEKLDAAIDAAIASQSGEKHG